MDPALVGIAVLLCLGLAVGKNIGKDPNAGCGKTPAVAAGGGAVAGGAAISKAGLLGTKAATVGAKAVGVGATATLGSEVARVGGVPSEMARAGATISEDVARAGATMSDDVARTAAIGGHADGGVDGAAGLAHAARAVNDVGHAGDGSFSGSHSPSSVAGAAAPSTASGQGASCTHANPELRGLTRGTFPTAFQQAIVQPGDPEAHAWSSGRLWSHMTAAVVMDPCDPTIDSLDLEPLQRAVVLDESGKYLVLVLAGDRMLVEFADGAKLLLAPQE